MVRELIRLDEKQRPLKAVYQVYETHAIPEMVGEINYDIVPDNRFEFSYYGILRARLLALWDAEKITAQELGNMLQAVANSNIDADPFQDESVAKANDENIIEMVTNLEEVNVLLGMTRLPSWNSKFDDIEPIFTGEEAKSFGEHLISSVEKLRADPVSMLSEEQYDAYEALATFFIESPNGVGIS